MQDNLYLFFFWRFMGHASSLPPATLQSAMCDFYLSSENIQFSQGTVYFVRFPA